MLFTDEWLGLRNLAQWHTASVYTFNKSRDPCNVSERAAIHAQRDLSHKWKRLNGKEPKDDVNQKTT